MLGSRVIAVFAHLKDHFKLSQKRDAYPERDKIREADSYCTEFTNAELRT